MRLFYFFETALIACLVFAHFFPPWALYLDGKPLPMAWYFARELPIPVVSKMSTWKAQRENETIALRYRIAEPTALVDWYSRKSFAGLGNDRHAFMLRNTGHGVTFSMLVEPDTRGWKKIQLPNNLEKLGNRVDGLRERLDEPGASGAVLELNAPDAGDEAGWR